MVMVLLEQCQEVLQNTNKMREEDNVVTFGDQALQTKDAIVSFPTKWANLIGVGTRLGAWGTKKALNKSEEKNLKSEDKSLLEKIKKSSSLSEKLKDIKLTHEAAKKLSESKLGKLGAGIKIGGVAGRTGGIITSAITGYKAGENESKDKDYKEGNLSKHGGSILSGISSAALMGKDIHTSRKGYDLLKSLGASERQLKTAKGRFLLSGLNVAGASLQGIGASELSHHIAKTLGKYKSDAIAEYKKQKEARSKRKQRKKS